MYTCKVPVIFFVLPIPIFSTVLFSQLITTTVIKLGLRWNAHCLSCFLSVHYQFSRRHGPHWANRYLTKRQGVWKRTLCVCMQKNVHLSHLFWSAVLECLLWQLLMVHGVWKRKSLSVYVRIMLYMRRCRLGFAQRPMSHHCPLLRNCGRESANYTNLFFTLIFCSQDQWVCVLPVRKCGCKVKTCVRSGWKTGAGHPDHRMWFWMSMCRDSPWGNIVAVSNKQSAGLS